MRKGIGRYKVTLIIIVIAIKVIITVIIVAIVIALRLIVVVLLRGIGTHLPLHHRIMRGQLWIEQLTDVASFLSGETVTPCYYLWSAIKKIVHI